MYHILHATSQLPCSLTALGQTQQVLLEDLHAADSEEGEHFFLLQKEET